ncbi:hypothetical protein ALT721_1980003 [Alteromonas alvinellae]
MPPARHQSLPLSGGCITTRGITSGQGRNRPHAAALETKIQSKQVSQRCQNTHFPTLKSQPQLWSSVKEC